MQHRNSSMCLRKASALPRGSGQKDARLLKIAYILRPSPPPNKSRSCRQSAPIRPRSSNLVPVMPSNANVRVLLMPSVVDAGRPHRDTFTRAEPLLAHLMLGRYSRLHLYLSIFQRLPSAIPRAPPVIASRLCQYAELARYRVAVSFWRPLHHWRYAAFCTWLLVFARLGGPSSARPTIKGFLRVRLCIGFLSNGISAAIRAAPACHLLSRLQLRFRIVFQA